MTPRNVVNNQAAFPGPLLKSMLIGGGIALLTIIFFISTPSVDPAWGKYWMIRPLIITPAAGAAGGTFYHFMGRLRNLGGWQKAAGIFIGILGFLFALWVGIILGLDGTLWD